MLGKVFESEAEDAKTRERRDAIGSRDRVTSMHTTPLSIETYEVREKVQRLCKQNARASPNKFRHAYTDQASAWNYI